MKLHVIVTLSLLLVACDILHTLSGKKDDSTPRGKTDSTIEIISFSLNQDSSSLYSDTGKINANIRLSEGSKIKYLWNLNNVDKDTTEAPYYYFIYDRFPTDIINIKATAYLDSSVSQEDSLIVKNPWLKRNLFKFQKINALSYSFVEEGYFPDYVKATVKIIFNNIQDNQIDLTVTSTDTSYVGDITKNQANVSINYLDSNIIKMEFGKSLQSDSPLSTSTLELFIPRRNVAEPCTYENSLNNDTVVIECIEGRYISESDSILSLQTSSTLPYQRTTNWDKTLGILDSSYVAVRGLGSMVLIQKFKLLSVEIKK